MESRGIERRRGTHTGSGFTLIELLIVATIIAISAAMAIPAIAQYIKNYRIRAATQQVAGEMNSARSKAVMKNVNLGVVFAVETDTAHRWVVEDDQQPQTLPNWFTVGSENWATLTGDPAQAGTLQTLPLNVVFDDPANCNAPAGVNTWGVRFTQMGSACSFGSAGCGAAPPGAAMPNNRVRLGGGTATVCLWETTSGLRRTVTITPGGRVLAQQ